MRTASLVLGIIGAVLAVIFALIFMFGGAAMNILGGEAANQLAQIDAEGADEVAGAVQAGTDLLGGSFYLLGALSIVGAILGIVGLAQLRKRHVVAAILIIVAAIPSFFTTLGFIAAIFFILAGIFAFLIKNEEKAAAPVVPAA